MLSFLSVIQSCYIRFLNSNDNKNKSKNLREFEKNLDYNKVFFPVLDCISNYKPFPQNGQLFEMDIPVGKDNVTLSLIRPDEKWGFSRDIELSKLFVSETPPISYIDKQVIHKPLHVSSSATSSISSLFSPKPTIYTLSPNDIISLHNWLLVEKSVLVVGNNHGLSDIADCCYGLLGLLLPFEWKNLFIALLPSSLIDMIAVCVYIIC
jgi:hypothetical protein